jgi:hypothetical protein
MQCDLPKGLFRAPNLRVLFHSLPARPPRGTGRLACARNFFYLLLLFVILLGFIADLKHENQVFLFLLYLSHYIICQTNDGENERARSVSFTHKLN